MAHLLHQLAQLVPVAAIVFRYAAGGANAGRMPAAGPVASRQPGQQIRRADHEAFGSLQAVLPARTPVMLATGIPRTAIRRNGKGGRRRYGGAADAIAIGASSTTRVEAD